MTHPDAQFCEQVTRRHARTFSVASLLLPAEKRRATYALYAFCRVADDLVDLANDGLEAGSVTQRLDQHRRALDRALCGAGTDAVFRELAWATDRFAIPAAPLVELLDGVAVDITARPLDTWSNLLAYCEGVAGSVGEMCLAVMSVGGTPGARPLAVTHARALGVAMQLTNVLRDIGEDARRGRCYVPTDELLEFGFAPDDVITGRAARRRDAWEGLMRRQVTRARHYYHLAAPGIPMLDADSRRCASACASGYARILDAIERNGYDTFTQRARLGWRERAVVLGRALLDPAGAARGSLDDVATA
ncbi:MAG: phytoene/squalene synthase family protein [Gemmatimonadaceae bacterium]|nr:phytoene/squalene synthase family protein [Gemmatimonadaceae bacterium]